MRKPVNFYFLPDQRTRQVFDHHSENGTVSRCPLRHKLLDLELGLLELLTVILDIQGVIFPVLGDQRAHHELNEHFLTRGRWRGLHDFLFRGFVVIFAPQEFLEDVWVHA
jgi:hypothetical protein